MARCYSVANRHRIAMRYRPRTLEMCTDMFVIAACTIDVCTDMFVIAACTIDMCTEMFVVAA